MKKIISFFGFILSLIFNNHISRFCAYLKCSVITSNFKRALKKHGKRISVSRYNKFEGLKNVEVGDDFSSQDGLWLATYNDYYGYKYNPSVVIGNNVKFSRYCHISCINKITIKDNVLFGNNVMINDNSHGNTFDFSKPRNQLELISKGEILIGNNCWIGNNVVILGNVTLGDNVIVAANSVVNKSFEGNCLIAGNPAKIIKKLEEK